jgi:hypothetical protein
MSNPRTIINLTQIPPTPVYKCTGIPLQQPRSNETDPRQIQQSQSLYEKYYPKEMITVKDCLNIKDPVQLKKFIDESMLADREFVQRLENLPESE